ncbi:MAG: hypothetical protein ABEK50_06450 [bacterium]
MPLSEESQLEQKQRVDVTSTVGESDEVKISVERFDENLGWYTAGSMRVPRHMLPMLEQALQQEHQSGETGENGTVLPFPTIAG